MCSSKEITLELCTVGGQLKVQFAEDVKSGDKMKDKVTLLFKEKLNSFKHLNNIYKLIKLRLLFN